MKIEHITIQTVHFEKELDFYKRYVNLVVLNDMRPLGRNMVFLAREQGETQLEIIEKPGAECAGNENISIGFHTENLEMLRQRLLRDGFEPTAIISPMPQVEFFFVKDPAGVTVQFL